MENLNNFAVLVALSQQEAYRQDRQHQILYPEPVGGLGYTLTRLLNGLGVVLSRLGQVLQRWGHPAETSRPEEAWS